MHGEGTLHFINGEKFSGTLKNNLFNGSGRYYFLDGDVYDGEFKNSLLHGQGEIISQNDLSFEAEWKDSELIQVSIMIDDNNLTELIEIKKQYLLNCPASSAMLWNYCYGKANVQKNNQDAIYYEGLWVSDQPHGLGELYISDELNYQGFFENGKFHGKGKMFYATDVIFNGHWVNGEKHGDGFFLDSISKRQIHGEWNHGKAINEFFVIDENGEIKKVTLEDTEWFESDLLRSEI